MQPEAPPATSNGLSDPAPAGNAADATDEFLDRLEALARKPSFKTGEFWLTVAAVLIANGLAAKGIISGDGIAVIDIVTPAVFQWLRQNYKSPAQEQALDMLQAASAAAGAPIKKGGAK